MIPAMMQAVLLSWTMFSGPLVSTVNGPFSSIHPSAS